MINRPVGGWNVTASTHPGEMLEEEFMKPLGISTNKLSRELHVPVSRVHDIIRKRRGLTAETACRLALFFGNEPEFWINLQSSYDLAEARKGMKAMARQIKPLAAAS